MEINEFYDSLDEESNYGSTLWMEFTKNTPSIPADNVEYKESFETAFQNISHLQLDALSDDDDNVVPFYEKGLNKSELELCKEVVKNDGPSSDSKNKTRRSRPHLPSFSDRLQSKSYLDLFYAKHGHPSLKNVHAKAAASNPESKSFTSCENFEVNSSYAKSETNCSESSRYCDKCGDTRGGTQNHEIGSNQEHCPTDILSLSLTTVDSNSKVTSSSTNQEIDNCDVLCAREKVKRKKPKPFATRYPELGKLGPVIPMDKLECYKRRQEYGLKVSQKNKIKMMERRLLQDLQHEINDSH